MARKLAAVAFSLGCLHASSLMALGLGEMKLESFLNEPFRASVDLLNMGGLHGDEIRIRLATTEDFEKLGVERAYFLTNITFEVVADERGGARILMTSEEPVLEPSLDFMIEARWPAGRLLRGYTVLVDPPVFSQATPVVSASERVQEVEGIAAPAKKNEQVPTSGASASADVSNIGAWGSEGGPSGGTRVDIRDSNLAPGAMPQRDYSASTESRPTPGGRYMIRRDQTLWDIANQAKPGGASVHQTMLDIQRLNPDAFINGNINRIKAGYIIYLPSANDISSADLDSALAEVREQNQAWREGRDKELYARSGPSLRISAEPEDTAVTTSAPGDRTVAAPRMPAAVEEEAPDNTAAAARVEPAVQGSADIQQRLAALEQQIETLQRIASLKDDQIAALQAALANAGEPVEEIAGIAPPETTPEAAVAAEDVQVEESVSVPATDTDQPAATAQVADPEAAPAKAPAAKPAAPKKTADPVTGDSWPSYLLYLLGALVLAVAGFVFFRRRTAAEGEGTPARQEPSSKDVFSDVRLREPNIELVPAAEEAQDAPVIASKRNNRGYGEHKHDEYASDIDAADALAEADIYIAYGRHPQAIDLLNNALANEPGNPVYRLKLLEIYTELNNRVAATAQLKKIQSLGDADSIARAESLMDGLHSDVEPETPRAEAKRPASNGPGLSPNPLAMLTDTSEPMEADFSALEIEGAGTSGEDDDLDLSGDFDVRRANGIDDEELVIAADSNGLSTKLDLARAYLDMGDDEGARQILEEVVAEGTEELKSEARALLDRIGG